MRATWILGAMLGLAISAAAADPPMSVFVVHCEPTTASDVMWERLEELVALADRFRIPLSIDFTAQWAERALADDERIALLESWIGSGHEIGCHHHPYWTTLDRPASWDGYTNTPLEEIRLQDEAKYVGTMADYMALLDALPGERRSGCLGGSDPRDEADWPCSLVYATAGHTVEEGVSMPVVRSISGCPVVEIGHALLVSAGRGELPALHAATAPDRVFGVVGHVVDFAQLPAAFEAWFSYLHGKDRDDRRRGTVSGVLDQWEGTD